MVKVHSMDFDDTWHPATHPSGAVLPALLALAESLPQQPSGLDLLLAFNVGIEVQGRLMRFSREALNIPERLSSSRLGHIYTFEIADFFVRQTIKHLNSFIRKRIQLVIACMSLEAFVFSPPQIPPSECCRSDGECCSLG